MPEKLYNLDLLKKLTHNNKEVILKMTHTFIDQSSKSIIDLRSAFESKKPDLLSAIAHKIKPTFAYFAIDGATNELTMIEMMAVLNTNSNELEAIISRLEVITAAVITEMRQDAELSTSTYTKTAIVSN